MCLIGAHPSCIINTWRVYANLQMYTEQKHMKNGKMCVESENIR